MTEADLIIIGAGPGGYEVAAGQAAAGKRVVVIERDEPGGTCLNRGCIPTKCLCAAAGTLRTVRGAAAFGIDISGVNADYAQAVERMRGIVSGLRDGVSQMLAGCTYVKGEARITADGHVQVGDELYTAPKVLIATGSRPARLPFDDGTAAITSDELLQRTTLPASIAIIGGGVIGLEFADILNAYGVEVTVVEYCKEVLPPFDAEIAKRLRSLMSRRGVKFVLGAAVTEIGAIAGTQGNDVEPHGNDVGTRGNDVGTRGNDVGTRVSALSSVAPTETAAPAKFVTYTGKKGPETLHVHEVLTAVGRRPVVPAGLADAGIGVDKRGFIVTDEHMQTTRPGFYAVGDCNGRLMLAHAATAQARVALGQDVCLSAILSAVFTEPECAMVGLTSEQCATQGIPVRTAKAMFAGSGKAQAMGQTQGLVKTIYHAETDAVLGCHICGPHAADLIQEMVIPVANAMTASDLRRYVHGHPTLSEVLAATF